MAIYFKFNSWNETNYDTIPLDTSSVVITVGELKQLISKKKKIDRNTGLVLVNPQSKEGWSLRSRFSSSFTIEYKDDNQFVQKNASVIVRMVPISTGQRNQPSNTKSIRYEYSLDCEF
jgi:hypothetical protein